MLIQYCTFIRTASSLAPLAAQLLIQCPRRCCVVKVIGQHPSLVTLQFDAMVTKRVRDTLRDFGYTFWRGIVLEVAFIDGKLYPEHGSYLDLDVVKRRVKRQITLESGQKVEVLEVEGPPEEGSAQRGGSHISRKASIIRTKSRGKHRPAP